MCTGPRDLGVGWDTREQPILQVRQVGTVLLLAKGHHIIHVHTHSPFRLSNRYSCVFVFLPTLTHEAEGRYIFVSVSLLLRL